MQRVRRSEAHQGRRVGVELGLDACFAQACDLEAASKVTAVEILDILGTRSLKHLKENAMAVMVRLDDEQLERLYGILREQPVAGERVPAAWMATIDA